MFCQVVQVALNELNSSLALWRGDDLVLRLSTKKEFEMLPSFVLSQAVEEAKTALREKQLSARVKAEVTDRGRSQVERRRQQK